MTEKEIKLTACVPTYNRAKYLKCALTSLLNQSVEVDEIIVVDDSSTDNTRQTVEEFQKSGRVKYYYLEKSPSIQRHLSIVNTFNYCIHKASGEFISIVGDDDLVAYRWSETIKKTILSAKHKNQVNIFYFSLSIIDEHNHIRRNWPQAHKDKVLRGKEIFRKTNMVFGVLGNLVLRKSFFPAGRGYSCDCATFFDKDFYARLSALDTYVYFSAKNIFFCRSHSMQTSNTILHSGNTSQKINSFYENSRHICRINYKYKDIFIKQDPAFLYLIEKKYFQLFGTLFTNSVFFKEMSFLFLQGIFKAFTYKKLSIYKDNCVIIQEYFPQTRSLWVRLFFILYFIKYWVMFINIEGRIMAWLQFKRDLNLKILP